MLLFIMVNYNYSHFLLEGYLIPSEGYALLTHNVVSIDQAHMVQLNNVMDLFFLTELVSHTCLRTETVVVSIGI